jgi:hypothetical protein
MSEEKYKYICEQCNFKCEIKGRWEQHLKTTKHQTGKRKIRSDCKDEYKCEKCDYETKHLTTFKQHKLNHHSNKEEREKGFTYYCKLCDLGTFSKDLYKRHIDSDKHKIHMENYA